MKKTVLGVTFLGLLVALLVSTQAEASVGDEASKGQAIEENAADADLAFRGQGRADLCYAFAEEQLLKDLTCKSNCDLNASDWKYSIFDIAKTHQASWIRAHGKQSIEGDLTVDLLSNGASDVFPFQMVGVSQVRSSSCTLEREIFFLNRSQMANPQRLELADFLMDLYDRLRADTKINFPIIGNIPVSSALETLRSLALKASTKSQFLADVVNFEKCPDQVAIPRFDVQSRTESDYGKIESLIYPMLAKKKSLYVGVCAEVLKNEVYDNSPCIRHAVVAKNIRGLRCSQANCGTEIQVVDSAFFSPRPRNQDGSMWIPANLVIQSMVKSSKNFDQIRSSIVAKNEQQLNDAITIPLQKHLKVALEAANSNNFKRQVITASTNYLLSQLGSSSAEFIRYFVAILNGLRLEEASDLDQIPEVVLKAYEQMAVDQLKSISGNGIVWIE